MSEILLKGGALPDMPDYCGRTALHKAVVADDTDIASLLISFNANRQAVDKLGMKPMLVYQTVINVLLTRINNFNFNSR